VIGSLVDAALKVADRVLPDKKARDEFKLQLLKLEAQGRLADLHEETKRMQDQAKLNALEAQSRDPFRARWRPAVGWVCVAGLAYQFLLQPLAAWGSGIWGFEAPPTLDLGDLMTLLIGLLGLGTLRTTEKCRRRD
jgi:hypothetical protein